MFLNNFPISPFPHPMRNELSMTFAFVAGLVSFLSPCVLPLIPSYLSYMTGLSVEELARPAAKGSWKKAALHALLFILGFSTVFILLGATASVVGQLLAQHQRRFRQIGGILVIFLGVYLAGFLKIGFLSRERKFSLPTHPTGLLGSFLVGVIFSFGWSPCVGPILGSILILAGATESLQEGIFYLFVYALGLGIPFFLSAVAVNLFLSSFQRVKRYLHVIEVTSGCVLVGVGILLVTNTMFRLISFLNDALSPLVRLFNL